jgi:hypothetical protein
MKFKVGDRVIIDKVESGTIIEPLTIDLEIDPVPEISCTAELRSGYFARYVRVRYDKPKKFALGEITSSLHRIENLELDIATIRQEKLHKLL